MFEEAQSVIFTPEIDKLEAQLAQAHQEMELLAKQGKYVLAQSIRQNADKIKRDLEAKRKQALQKRHRQEGKEVKNHLRQDLRIFNQEWDRAIKQLKDKGLELKRSLQQKHQKECDAEKSKWEIQIPSLGKESSELLNLRKIEEGLAKQQNFVEAHLVQQQIKQLYKKEEKNWQKCKQDKIQAEILALRSKQKMEIQALEKKLASQVAEMQLQRTKAEAQLALKHSVMKKGLQSQAKKQNLMASGFFKSKVDVLSPSRSILSPSKNRMLSSSSSWKMLPSMTR